MRSTAKWYLYFAGTYFGLIVYIFFSSCAGAKNCESNTIGSVFLSMVAALVIIIPAIIPKSAPRYLLLAKTSSLLLLLSILWFFGRTGSVWAINDLIRLEKWRNWPDVLLTNFFVLILIGVCTIFIISIIGFFWKEHHQSKDLV